MLLFLFSFSFSTEKKTKKMWNKLVEECCKRDGRMVSRMETEKRCIIVCLWWLTQKAPWIVWFQHHKTWETFFLSFSCSVVFRLSRRKVCAGEKSTMKFFSLCDFGNACGQMNEETNGNLNNSLSLKLEIPARLINNLLIRSPWQSLRLLLLICP